MKTLRLILLKVQLSTGILLNLHVTVVVVHGVRISNGQDRSLAVKNWFHPTNFQWIRKKVSSMGRLPKVETATECQDDNSDFIYI